MRCVDHGLFNGLANTFRDNRCLFQSAWKYQREFLPTISREPVDPTNARRSDRRKASQDGVTRRQAVHLIELAEMV
jgi:hypothetical protein